MKDQDEIEDLLVLCEMASKERGFREGEIL